MIVQERGFQLGRIPETETRRGRGVGPSPGLPSTRTVVGYGTETVVPSPLALITNVPLATFGA